MKISLIYYEDKTGKMHVLIFMRSMLINREQMKTKGIHEE